ncbi:MULTISPECIES: O-methyltransferase [Euryhalocaulis]|uniref:O-methyltransferase n=1 Tax=Euryhalocaulis TaxID=1712422 RepID=UPI0003A20B15|nr:MULTISPECIES: O-methyltransferase [Euryhalocaulis]MBA4800956.1 O-methyltransferase [Euryhalocaulis sp.]
MSRRTIGVSDKLDAYIVSANREEHPALARCRAETAERDDANMQIGAEQGAFMAFLARLTGARIYIEVGTFTGYSALAMALPMKEIHGTNARVIACDISEEFLDIAEGYWKEARVDDVIEKRPGGAMNSLKALGAEGLSDSVDMVFLDADKENYGAYYEEAASLLRPGGLMVLDNVLWSGKVAEQDADDPATRALREVAVTAKSDGRFDQVFLSLGDGLLLLRKRDAAASHIDGPDAASGRYPPENA